MIILSISLIILLLILTVISFKKNNKIIAIICITVLLLSGIVFIFTFQELFMHTHKESIKREWDVKLPASGELVFSVSDSATLPVHLFLIYDYSDNRNKLHELDWKEKEDDLVEEAELFKKDFIKYSEDEERIKKLENNWPNLNKDFYIHSSYGRRDSLLFLLFYPQESKIYVLERLAR